MLKLLILIAGLCGSMAPTCAQWLGGGLFSTVLHFQACAFQDVENGLFVYGANNPGPSSPGTEGGIIRTDDGANSGGYYIWYEPSCNIEDIDVKVVDGFPYYLAAGHQLYGQSIVLKQYLAFGNEYQFDSVRTGSNRYYRAVRMRSDLVAFTGGADYLGNGIIDISVDTGATWTNIAVLPGQPVSRLHFVNDQLGFAATGGYSRLGNNGVLLPDSGAIYRTINGGLDWEQVFADTTTGFSDVEFLNTSIGVATRNDGAIMRTTNGGDTWSPATVTWPGPYVMTSVVFRPDGTAFASCYRTDGTSGYILSSEDAGATWGFNFSTASFNHSRRIYDLYFFDDAHGYACTHIKPLLTDGIITEVVEQGSAAIDLFPNPTSDVVSFRLREAGTAQVELVDATGRTVRSMWTAGPNAMINVDFLTPGMYSIRVKEDGQQHSARFLKR
ncbi:MAG: T9SS type A sorting domain-containing protein [Flavobacteriales bacterium]|nr:T9SS type A sorting domain-containing protein [Flavobacteriales bacterium]